jgi:hypothetical protein
VSQYASLREELAVAREIEKKLKNELAEARRDIEMAAGELMVAMPEPGTDMARVMHANAMMRRERDRLRAALKEIEQRTGPEGDMADLAVNELARAALEGKP